MDSEQVWLREILARDLGPVEAPAALRTTLRQPVHKAGLAWGALAFAAGVLLVVIGVAGHAYVAGAVNVRAASGGPTILESVRPVNLQGACHLCHGSETL